MLKSVFDKVLIIYKKQIKIKYKYNIITVQYCFETSGFIHTVRLPLSSTKTLSYS